MMILEIIEMKLIRDERASIVVRIL